jgi:hypothetical protein
MHSCELMCLTIALALVSLPLTYIVMDHVLLIRRLIDKHLYPQGYVLVPIVISLVIVFFMQVTVPKHIVVVQCESHKHIACK